MILSNRFPNYILFDFDGTITTKDIAIQVLMEFADENWIKFDQMLDNSDISLEECMRLEYGMIKSGKNTILKFIEDKYVFREGFEEFVEFCNRSSIKTQIVSAGIDFVIDHILNIHDIKIDLKAIRAKARIDGMVLEFEEFKYPDSRDFKEDYIKELRSKGIINIIYVGDGSSDFHAAENADQVYCVSENKLEQYCIDNHINFRSFTSFKEIEDDIKNSLVTL